MDNPFEAPSADDQCKPKLGFVPKFVLWISWLIGWCFLLIGLMPAVALVIFLTGEDASFERIVNDLINDQSYWVGVGMFVAYTVLGLLLLWSSRRVGYQKYKLATIGFIASMIWATLAIPLLLGHL